ncbi:hypothetical protein SmJEL517_g03653 [Synchytrium microbalum]|uniref:Elongation factor 1 alpha-like protein n=1 Tax=Synchytrium microbalum TaxID=1806994 RepID=A0A507C253_9FUNG|nr:uncharacterized protein SmJEL517_g03653 [Synchytrium microbalum]TPX33448.1 hypothetical protein SmJEL517_g03653 [Synchytrium microbalum]
MSRHRSVRNMDLDEEMDDDYQQDDQYGTSYDDYGSPPDRNHHLMHYTTKRIPTYESMPVEALTHVPSIDDYIYRRDDQQATTMASFLELDDEDEPESTAATMQTEADDRVFDMEDVSSQEMEPSGCGMEAAERLSATCFLLNVEHSSHQHTESPLDSAKDHVKAVLGDTVSDADIDTALRNNNQDSTMAIDSLIAMQKSVQDVKAIVGLRFTDVQIKEVLGRNRNNVELSINEMLDKPPTSIPPGLSRPPGLLPPGLSASTSPPSTTTTQPSNNSNNVIPQAASPSAFAQALFTKSSDKPADKAAVLAALMNGTVAPSSDVTAFAFDSPSPDDVVAQARMKALASRPGARSSITKPRPSSTIMASSTSITSSSARLDQTQQELEGLKISAPFTSKPPIPESPAMTRTGSGSMAFPMMSRSGSSTSAFPVMSRSGSSSGLPHSGSQPSVSKPSPKMGRRVDVAELIEKRSTEKRSLNLVVIGHVDAGKSTIMGHLLYLLGEVNERTIKRYEREAEKIGKSSFRYAWVLDETEEERSRGITMDVAITKFETENRKFTLLDAPGHKDFIPNMISGASQADVAMLVVCATTGEFETGFESGGQTKEHALLVRSLGVNQLVVAINKLDAMNWDKSRYDEIVSTLTTFLVSAGFKRQNLSFIPCSGFTGGNLVSRDGIPELNQWYDGLTLKEQLDKLDVPERPFDRPFRMSVADFFKGGIGSGGGGSVSLSGRIEAGSVQLGDSVLLMPNGETGIVRALEIADDSVKWAAAGDSVLMSLANVEITNISIGTVLCDPNAPIPLTTRIKARIVTFEIAIPLTIGVKVVFHQKSLTEPAIITRLVEVVDKTTGQVTNRKPRALPRNTTATVEISIDRPICLETFQSSKELGRFMLRNDGKTLAAGIVIDILSYERVAGS